MKLFLKYSHLLSLSDGLVLLDFYPRRKRGIRIVVPSSSVRVRIAMDLKVIKIILCVGEMFWIHFLLFCKHFCCEIIDFGKICLILLMFAIFLFFDSRRKMQNLQNHKMFIKINCFHWFHTQIS